MSAPFTPPRTRPTIKFFSAHSRERAKERYNLDLSSTQMKDILRACKDGRATPVARQGACEVFIWRFSDRIIFPVVRDRSFIVTFREGSFLTAGWRLKRRGTKTVGATPKTINGHGPYSRARERRRALVDEGADE